MRSLTLAILIASSTVSPLCAQHFTGLAGSASEVDNTQPSLGLRYLLMAQGVYPQRGDGPGSPTFLPTGGPSVFWGEVRLFASTFGLHPDTPDALGQSVQIASNPALFSLLGVNYGGNGQTTFSYPNLGARVPHGPPLIYPGDIRGSASHLLSFSNLPPHRHDVGFVQTQTYGTGNSPLSNHQPSLSLNFIINARAEIRLFAGNYAPEGWALCHGQILNVSEHVTLHGYIGYAYGGNGTTTFALPDFRGRLPIGRGTGPGLTNRPLGQVAGQNSVTLQSSHIPAHSHGLTGGGSTSTGPAAAPFSNMEDSVAITFAVVNTGNFPNSSTNAFVSNNYVYGDVMMFATNQLPAGLLPCEGQLLSIQDNQILFALLGVNYGGDGQQTFALPDLRGRSPMGRPASGTPTMGQTLGSETTTLNTANLPPHVHQLPMGPLAIANPGFEADTYATFPGYASANGGAITGWTLGGNTGLNPAGGSSPFANNGSVPEGTKVAFLQSQTGVPATLATTVYGLTTGTTYHIRFAANARDYLGGVPQADWSVNGSPYMPLKVFPPVGGANPYYPVSGTFTATGPTANIIVRNQAAGDTSLLIDNFSIQSGQGEAWKILPWTNDAATGLSPDHTLWARRFGASDPCTINGVAIGETIGLNPNVAATLAVTGFGSSFPYDANTLTALGGSGSAVLARDFHYNANPGILTLQGLVPGRAYRASIFSVGWDASATRRNAFSSGNHGRVFDQNVFGNNQGLRLDHHFIASASSESVHIQPDSANTFHLYGLSLSEEVGKAIVESPPGTSIAGGLDFGTATVEGAGVPLTIHLRNAGLATLQIQSVSLVSGDTDDFLASPLSLPGSLAPGAGTSFQTTFYPGGGGPRAAVLRIATNDPNQPPLDLPLSGYGRIHIDFWRGRVFGEDSGEPLIAGNLRDPDGDGKINLLEYALRLDPNQPDASVFNLPVPVTLPPAIPARRFTFPYQAAAADLTYVLQRSSTLGGWDDTCRFTPATGALTEQPGLNLTADPESETITVDVQDLGLFTAPNFWRIKVELE